MTVALTLTESFGMAGGITLAVLIVMAAHHVGRHGLRINVHHYEEGPDDDHA